MTNTNATKLVVWLSNEQGFANTGLIAYGTMAEYEADKELLAARPGAICKKISSHTSQKALLKQIEAETRRTGLQAYNTTEGRIWDPNW